MVGCVQWEKDYRQFVLTFARVEGAGGRTAAGSVGTAGNGTGKKLTEGATYSITGDREKELARRIGQQVEVIGTLEERGARDTSAQATCRDQDDGVDPMKTSVPRSSYWIWVWVWIWDFSEVPQFHELQPYAPSVIMDCESRGSVEEPRRHT